MNDIIDYLTWRGDITFAERPFTEVDNLVLAEFSYIDFTGIVPAEGEDRTVTVADAFEILSERGEGAQVKALSSPGYYDELWRLMAASTRFGGARLSNYVDIYDEVRQTQFAALHIALEDGTTYIAFRGTDQTICGWREDFAMSFQVVDAQKEAEKYLRATMMPGTTYRLGGHSKGGNVAVYSAMMCGEERQGQIMAVYNNDGPGFSPELLQSRQYNAVKDKIIRIIPEFSVIGMLFEQAPPQMIVKSNADGVMQHSGTTWMIQGGSFVTADDLLPRCKAVNQVFDTWMEDVTMEQRPVFVEEFFGALEAGGSKNIDEVAKNGAGGFEAILSAMADTKKDTKSVIGKLIKSFAGGLNRERIVGFFKTKSIYRGMLVFLAGILFTKLPDAAVQIVAILGVFVVFFLAARRILFYVRQKRQWNNVNTRSIAIYSAVIALLTLFALNQSAFLWSANFTIGLLCCVYGYYNFKKWLDLRNKRSFSYWLSIIRAVVAMLLGVVVMIATGQDMGTYTLVLGSFMIIEGILEVVMGSIEKVRSQD